MTSRSGQPAPEALLAHHSFLVALARSLLRDEHAAEDAVQGAWVRALERPPRSADSARAWLARVTANLARNSIRGASRRRAREARGARAERLPSTAEIIAREDVRRTVLEAVLALDGRYRDVLLMRYYDELPPRRIAAALDVPVETVRTRLKRGLERLREDLDRREGGRECWTPALAAVLARGRWEAAGGSAGGAGWVVFATGTLIATGLSLWVGTRTPTAGARAAVPTGPRAAALTPSADTRPSAPAGVAPEAREPAREETEPSDAPVAVATIVVRVVENGAPLESFRAEVFGKTAAEALRPDGGSTYRAGYWLGRSSGGEQVVEVPVHPDEPLLYTIRLAEPRRAPRPERVVELREGERLEVVLLVGTPQVQGRVVDPRGEPIEGALVWSGPMEAIRGDEPFKPFRPERLSGGVTTGPDGRFLVAVAGGEVSVWHATWSPRTVALADGVVVRLDPRGAVEGELADDAGRPLTDVTLLLDGERSAVTDAIGRFRFDGVEVGRRGLLVPGSGVDTYVVDVAAGETATVDLALAEAPTELRLTGMGPVRDGGYEDGSFEGLLLGTGSLSTCALVELVDGRGSANGLLGGPYVLLSQGIGLCRGSVSGGRGDFTAGTGWIVVRAERGKRPYPFPSDADELLRLMCQRVLGRPVDEAGEVRLGPLPPGSYRVAFEGGPTHPGAVEVADDGVLLDLR